MKERMDMFWRKCEGDAIWTRDPILRKYKFTNVYRICDRVSQYLVRNVIYKDLANYSADDVLLRILIFKIFNKIETWNFLKENYGEITHSNFDVKAIAILLSQRQKYTPIFNNAYMMTGSTNKFSHVSSKHERWLTMVEQEFINKGIAKTILNADSLKDIYNLLRECTFIGDFLAYQYTIDFNYSPYINFSEDSFVRAGIGAIRGIKKCFISYGNSFEDAIIYVHDNFEYLMDKYNMGPFKGIPGHNPTLLDFQNCFCETDKYLRAKMPELHIDNSRIKQTYKENHSAIHFFFPPKWHVKLNKELCIQPNTMELTLF